MTLLWIHTDLADWHFDTWNLMKYIYKCMCSLNTVQYHNQSKELEKSLKYLNMGFTGMFSVETVLKIIGFGVKVGTNHKTSATL